MSDIDLFKELSKCGNKPGKLESLYDLQKRIQTDLFIAEYDQNTLKIGSAQQDLSFVTNCIKDYQNNVLTANSMSTLNNINRKYREPYNYV